MTSRDASVLSEVSIFCSWFGSAEHVLCTVFIAVVFGGKSLYVSVCVCFVLLSYVVCYLLKSLYDVGYTMMVSRFVAQLCCP